MTAYKGLYVNVDGAWLKVFGGSDPNAPGAPTNVVRVGNVITFDAGAPGLGGPTLSYVANIEPKGPTLKFDDSIDPSVGGKLTITDLVTGVDYTVEIFGVSAVGRGKGATVGPFQAEFNSATGGSVQDIDNYNGSGQKWRLHTFTSTDTFTVNTVVNPFRIVMCGQGGNGSRSEGCDGNGNGAGGGGGQFIEHKDFSIDLGDHSISVGSTAKAFGMSAIPGGGGGRCYHDPGHPGANGASGGGGGTGNGGASALAGGKATVSGQGNGGPGHQFYGGGQGGGARGNGGGYNGWPGPGATSNIRGKTEYYCSGGRGSAAAGSRPSVYGGGGGIGCNGCNPGPGQTAAVLIAYQIG